MADDTKSWEEICDLITISARAASQLGHSLDDNETSPDALKLEHEFYKNIKGYCEQNLDDIEMVMENPEKYSR